MSHNPTYDPEPGYDQSYSPYSDQGRDSPQQQDFSNMASYRQATTGVPPSVGAPDNGKSYRYATDAIPEDEEEGGDGHVHFTNGGQPTKTYSTSSEPKSSSSCWSRYGLYIMIGLAIFFAIMFFIFLGLYVRGTTDGNTQPGTAAPQVGQTLTSTTPASTTTPEPEQGTPIGSGQIDGARVTKFTLTNSRGVEVELLSLGARINKMIVNGVDYVLGFNTPENANITEIAKYMFGAANGRLCGDLDSLNFGGTNYPLTPAAGETQFSEGGAKGLYKMNFAGVKTGQTVTFTKSVTSAMDDLPGSADITVMYTLDDTANKLTVSMMASPTGNSDSLIDMCNSVRFNLNGDGSDATQHQLMVNANNYYRAGEGWLTVAGAANFSSPTAPKPKIDAVTSPNVTPNLRVFQYAYQLLGATGMRLAGTISSGSKQVTIHSNQDVARIAVKLDAMSVPGKAAQPYGPRSYISFITHANAYEAGTDHILLKSGSTYKSEVSYTLT